MAAIFDHPAAAEHQDPIGVADRAQAVGNDHARERRRLR